jgi:hypothetical protein
VVQVHPASKTLNELRRDYIKVLTALGTRGRDNAWRRGVRREALPGVTQGHHSPEGSHTPGASLWQPDSVPKDGNRLVK